jgi:hypothetical protein
MNLKFGTNVDAPCRFVQDHQLRRRSALQPFRQDHFLLVAAAEQLDPRIRLIGPNIEIIDSPKRELALGVSVDQAPVRYAL